MKTPIALLIGRGSRIRPLIDRQINGQAGYEIISVVSHKAMDQVDGVKKHVPGIQAAHDAKINTAYFNLVQMRNAAQKAFGADFNQEDFTKDYFKVLAAYLMQSYPQKPRVVFCQGWDLVLNALALKFATFINFHPALLPENPGEQIVTISSGERLPVLKGEHDEVITQALKLGLPVLGVTAHLITPLTDEGGEIISKIEVPLKKEDTLASFEARLKPIEEQFVIEVVERVCQRPAWCY